MQSRAIKIADQFHLVGQNTLRRLYCIPLSRIFEDLKSPAKRAFNNKMLTRAAYLRRASLLLRLLVR